jgi:hypothetical protein
MLFLPNNFDTLNKVRATTFIVENRLEIWTVSDTVTTHTNMRPIETIH